MERKLVVLGIPWDVDTDGLKEYMIRFGELEDCIVMKERSTGRSRGFGYVTFASGDDAKKALSSEHVLGNRMLEVKVATPKEEMMRTSTKKVTRIFVARIAQSVNESAFRSHFESYGEITDLYMPKDPSTKGHRGIGFITFAKPESVDNLMVDTHELGGTNVVVDRATPKDDDFRPVSRGASQGGGGGGGGYGAYNAYISAATRYAALGAPTMYDHPGSMYGKSAFRERRTRSSRLKRKSIRPQGSSLKGLQSPLSGEKCEKNIPDSNPRLEKLGPVTDREAKSDAKKQISPVVFYGSPHGVPPKRPSSLLRLLREIRIDLAEKHRSNLRKEIWATFPKQDEAMKFSREHPNVYVFSYQDHFNGQRRFLVSSHNDFWQRYKNMDGKFRHHYEVIQEGLPCHLYFDLEFERSENADKNGDQMVDLLISVVFDLLHEKYCIQGDLDWIVELDSSTKAKFSRHLLIRIPKAAFKDNSHAGVFVNEICSRICNAREKDVRFEQLFISKDSSASRPSSHLFVDTAVYTRNRCFRLALSSKAGKTSVLLPSGRFRCKDMCEEDVFFASLICNIDNDCEKLLICKTDIECVKTLHYDTEVNYDNIKQLVRQQPCRFDACPSDASRTYMMGKSPFPALDAFIESLASIGNESG